MNEIIFILTNLISIFNSFLLYPAMNIEIDLLLDESKDCYSKLGEFMNLSNRNVFISI